MTEEIPMRSAPCFTPRRVAAWIVLALLIAGPFAAGSARAAVGEAGFAFLKIGVGARAMGLGSAFVAVADDPTALHWNPAGLAAGRNGITLTAMHNEWIEDFRQEFVAVSGPVGPGALGASFTGFYTSELERRDETGVLTGHFGFNDIAANVGYGLTVATGLDAGASVRYIREMIADEDATSIAFDLGGRYTLRDTGLSLGAAVQNLGGDATFVSEGFPLPRTVRAGAAYRRAIPSAQGTVLLSTEYRSARGEDSRFHVGGEFAYREWLALRAGMKFGYDEQDVSFGLGLARGPIHFDYAILPVGANLGTSHFFSVSANL
jgi:hypothetical protein